MWLEMHEWRKVEGGKVKEVMGEHRSQPHGPREDFGFCLERTRATGNSEQKRDAIWLGFSQAPSGYVVGEGGGWETTKEVTAYVQVGGDGM